MKFQKAIIFVAVIILITGFKPTNENASREWEHPLVKMGRLNSPLVEVEPFVFNDELYLLENWRSHWDWPRRPGKTGRNEMWIAHLPDGPENYSSRKYISAALKGNTLGTAFVWQDRVYVFGVNEASERQFVEMSWSEDLKTWSEPVKVFDSPKGKIFNVSVTRDDKGFVFLWETNGVGTPFTMCFGRLDNLTDKWNDHIIEDAVYGKEKYTGGPEVIYTDGWYYLLYAERNGAGWETRITRSRDLINWQDAPENHPFVSFDKDHKNLPLHPPDIHEINATDPGLTTYGEQVFVWFTGGIQQKGGDLQWAVFNGNMNELMKSYFDGSFKREPLRFGMVTGIKPEKIDYYKELHANPWEGVLKTIKESNIENYSIYLQNIDKKFYLFSYFEYTGHDYAKDMKKMAADTTTQRWWQETDPCQIPLPAADAKNQIWTQMEEVFHTE